LTKKNYQVECVVVRSINVVGKEEK